MADQDKISISLEAVNNTQAAVAAMLKQIEQMGTASAQTKERVDTLNRTLESLSRTRTILENTSAKQATAVNNLGTAMGAAANSAKSWNSFLATAPPNLNAVASASTKTAGTVKKLSEENERTGTSFRALIGAITGVMGVLRPFESALGIGGITGSIARVPASIGRASGAFKILGAEFGVLTGAAIALGAALGALVILTGAVTLVKLTSAAIASAGQLQILSGRLGVSVEQLSSFEHIANRTGVSVEAFTASLTHYGQTLAKNGTPTNNLLRSLVDLSAIYQIIPTQSEKIEFAIQKFGEQGRAMTSILALGPEAIARMADQADKVGITSARAAGQARELQNAWSDMIDATKSLVREWTFNFLPILTTILKGLTDILAAARQFSLFSLPNIPITSGQLGAGGTAGVVGGNLQSLATAQAPKVTIESLEARRKELALMEQEQKLLRERLEIEGTGANRNLSVELSLNESLRINGEERATLATKRALVEEKISRLQIDGVDKSQLLLELGKDELSAKQQFYQIQRDSFRLNQENLKLQLTQGEQARRLEFDRLEASRATVQSNFRLPPGVARSLEISILQKEVELIDEEIAKLTELRAKQGDQASLREIDAKLSALAEKRTRTSGSLDTARLSADPNSFFDQWTLALNRFGTVAQEAASTLAGAFSTAFDSIGHGLTGLIMGTETWAGLLNKIATSVLDAVISGIVKMFATWIVQTLLMNAVTQAAGVETGATLAASYAPAAAASGAATLGIGSVVGVVLTVAAIIAAIAALSGAFAEGGFTGSGGKYEPAGIVHRGEVVIPKEQVEELGLAHFAQYFAGRMPGYAAGGLVGGYSVPSVPRMTSNISVNIAQMQSRQDERDALARDSATIVVDKLRRKGNLVKG